MQRGRVPSSALTLCRRGQARAKVEKQGHPVLSAMGSGLLVRNAFNRALFCPDRRTRQSLHHGARAFRIGDPFLIEVVRTDCLTSYVLPRIDLARVSAMHKLEQMILRLHVPTSVTDQRLGKLGVLNPHILFSALAQGPTIEP